MINKQIKTTHTYAVFKDVIDIVYPSLSGTFDPYNNEVLLVWEGWHRPQKHIYVPFVREGVDIRLMTGSVDR